MTLLINLFQLNKALTVWKKDAAGSWKNVVDMWIANPAQPSK